jgi:hypothetical protein
MISYGVIIRQLFCPDKTFSYDISGVMCVTSEEKIFLMRLFLLLRKIKPSRCYKEVKRKIIRQKEKKC